jgi:hypothetical protein
MKLQPKKEGASSAPEIMVEVIGRDGLVHHVGPFKSRDDANAWIAQNSSADAPAADRAAKKFATGNWRDPASTPSE